jgi:pimeloyl-ACP methyl ester carboxylesterase
MLPAMVGRAAAHGLRLISYDRPGYGDSPASPGRCVADAAADARAIAGQLGLTRIGAWGYSGGAPYALACAALAPDLVAAACVFASLAPPDAAGLDYLASWPPQARAEIELFRSDPEQARAKRWAAAAQRLPALATAGGWLEMWGETHATASPERAAAADYLAAVQQDTLCRSDQGWWDDNVAFLTPWGFDVADISVPVQLWHGERDQAVPSAHGHWLAGQVPGVQAHFLPEDDHGSIQDDHLDEAFGWLARQLC